MDLLCLGSDMVTHICSYLPYINVISLRWTCKAFRNPNFIKLTFKDIVLRKLKELGCQDLNDALIKYGNAISGSFNLQCLYGEQWKDSDIDVYCCSELKNFHIPPSYLKYDLSSSLKELIEQIKSKMQNPEVLALGILYDWLEKRNCRWIDTDSYPDTPITSRVYNILKNPSSKEKHDETPENSDNLLFKLNHIIIHEFPTIKEAISEFFDLSICKTIYDGNILHIQNILSMIKKESKVVCDLPKYCHINALRLATFNRMIKYQERGFKITNFKKFYSIIKDHLNEIRRTFDIEQIKINLRVINESKYKNKLLDFNEISVFYNWCNHDVNKRKIYFSGSY